VIPNSLNAQDKKKVIETKGAKMEQTSTRGAGDQHIKGAKPADDKVVVEKPKGTRGEYCKVIIDNWTGYTVDVYVDGDYSGSCAAWGEGYTYAIPGKTELYAKSVGGTVYWGPVYVDCQYEYTWQLSY
jgi:hypothetical protein